MQSLGEGSAPKDKAGDELVRDGGGGERERME